MQVERLTADEARAILASLVDLLQDAVDAGASVGFLPPLRAETAKNYWLETLVEVADGRRVLLAAMEAREVKGTVQVEFASKQNASHRGEVQKLLVDRRFSPKGHCT